MPPGVVLSAPPEAAVKLTAPLAVAFPLRVTVPAVSAEMVAPEGIPAPLTTMPV